MSVSSRPVSHAQRDQITRTLSSYLASGTADPTVADLYTRFFAATASAYTNARIAWFSAHGAWQAASHAADDADEVFDAALRRLMVAFRDENGSVDAALNASLLGGVQMSELIAMRYAEEVSRARAFLARLAERTDLHPNAERLSIFTEATDALDKAATAEDLALSARLAAGSAMESATAAFDTDWGKLVRALRAMVDAAVFETVVPRFVSKTPADSGEEG